MLKGSDFTEIQKEEQKNSLSLTRNIFPNIFECQKLINNKDYERYA
jgi:hypothetical protein